MAISKETYYRTKAYNATTENERKKYESEANKWAEGGIYKVALHGAFGGMLGNFSSGNAAKGALSASVNELIKPALKGISDPNIQKLASLVIGRVATNSEMGAAIAESATKNNWLDHYDQMALLHVLQTKEGDDLAASLGYYYALNEAVGIRQEHAKKIEITDAIDPTIDGSYGNIKYKSLNDVFGFAVSHGNSFTKALDNLIDKLNFRDNLAFKYSYAYYSRMIDDKYLSKHYPKWGGTFDSYSEAIIANAQASQWGTVVRPFVFKTEGDRLAAAGYPSFVSPIDHKIYTHSKGLDYNAPNTDDPTYGENRFGDYLAKETNAIVYDGKPYGWSTNFVLHYGTPYWTSAEATATTSDIAANIDSKILVDRDNSIKDENNNLMKAILDKKYINPTSYSNLDLLYLDKIITTTTDFFGLKATSDATKAFTAADRKSLEGSLGITKVSQEKLGDGKLVDIVRFGKDSNYTKALKNDLGINLKILEKAKELARDRGIGIEEKPVRLVNSFRATTPDSYLATGTYISHAIVSYNKQNDSYVINVIPVDTWDNNAIEGMPAIYFGILSPIQIINPIRAAYNVEAARLRTPYIVQSDGYNVEIKDGKFK